MATLLGLAMLVGLAPQLAYSQEVAEEEAAVEEETEPEVDLNLAPPIDVTMETADGVRIVATYYEGVPGKDAVPVIAVHGFGQSRQDMADLALYLQEQGYCVITPDLRGHGDSTTVKGTERNLDASRMRRPDLERMVRKGGDLEQVKAFLIQKNNEGKVNIKKLCVIGAGFGGLAAINWTALDYNWPDLLTGEQGKDVRALILVSPIWNYEGMTINEALRTPAIDKIVPVYLTGGEDNQREFKEIQKLAQRLRTKRPKAENLKDNKLFFQPEPTSLQGTDLLNQDTLSVKERIAVFIKLKAKEDKTPWKERKRPTS